MACSFTKAAAVELGSRDLPLPPEHVGTLHALCYHELDRPTIAETKIKEWNETCPNPYRLSGAEVDKDEPEYDQKRETPGDDLLQRMEMNVARLVPMDGWRADVASFHEAWEDWKKQCGYISFSDMIGLGYSRIDTAPGDPAFFAVDEAQDLNPAMLRLARKWGGQAKEFFMVGDDDQCQPTGTIVATTKGEKAIENLDETADRLVSYDRGSSTVVGWKEGYAFKRAQREYAGFMITLSAEGKKTACTPDHHWLIRWNTEARHQRAVYLVRKGKDFRIGWCKLLRADGTFQLGVRAHLEKADAAWILAVTDDSTEASIQESYLATEYGIPTIMFQARKTTPLYTQDNINWLFAQIDTNMRALKLLSSFGLDPKRPFWTQKEASSRRGGSQIMKVAACNLLASSMSVPMLETRREVEWVSFQIDKGYGERRVYSLEVDKHHLYFADGFLTCNCIYGFTGASAGAFLNPPLPAEQKNVLSQSYRVPRAIHAISTKWIEQVTQREQKLYRPRDAEGCIGKLGGGYRKPDALAPIIKQALDGNHTVMILASCSYMLYPAVAWLKAEGIPFHNPYRRKRGDWNPLHVAHGTGTADRLLAFLRPNVDTWGDQVRMWTRGDVCDWGALLQAAGIFRRGGKSALSVCERWERNEIVSPERLLEYFEEEALGHAWDTDTEWLQEHAMAEKAKHLAYPLQIKRLRGGKALRETPLVTVGTIHSVKGAEAEVVVLYPDISYAGMQEWTNSVDGRDGIVRQFYVGMTRAKSELWLGESSGPCVQL